MVFKRFVVGRRDLKNVAGQMSTKNANQMKALYWTCFFLVERRESFKASSICGVKSGAVNLKSFSSEMPYVRTG
jgi:hypothetical protein